jgi:hypothetical protein
VPFIDHEKVSWQPPVNNGGASIVNYRICFTGSSSIDCYDTGMATSFDLRGNGHALGQLRGRQNHR